MAPKARKEARKVSIKKRELGDAKAHKGGYQPFEQKLNIGMKFKAETQGNSP
jgi:hypothetical protein